MRYRYIAAILLASLCVGFRTLGDIRWKLTAEEPTVWIDFDESTLDATLEGEDGDPDMTGREIIMSVVDEINAVPTSRLHVQVLPGQIPEFDTLRDGDINYSESYAATHTVTVESADSSGASGGDARADAEDGVIVGCRIRLSSAVYEKVNGFRSTIAHELMHCMGVAHQHGDSDSLMSYSSSTTHLSLEEKMALTYLYPLDDTTAAETPSFGLACEPTSKAD